MRSGVQTPVSWNVRGRFCFADRVCLGQRGYVGIEAYAASQVSIRA